MRSTFKTVFYVNGSKEKNGIVPIMDIRRRERGFFFNERFALHLLLLVRVMSACI